MPAAGLCQLIQRSLFRQISVVNCLELLQQESSLGGDASCCLSFHLRLRELGRVLSRHEIRGWIAGVLGGEECLAEEIGMEFVRWCNGIRPYLEMSKEI